MCACRIPQGKKPFEIESLELLKNDECLKSITTYAVRFHDRPGKRPMFDYCLGDPSGSVCIDFIIPIALTPEEIEKKLPKFPGEEPQLLIFLPVHDIEFLNAPAWKINPIPEGTYGAGNWWIVQTGKARMEKTPHGYLLCLDGIAYQLVPYSGRKENEYLVWKSVNEKKVMACGR